MIKLQFQNFWGGFPVHDNIVTVALKMLDDVKIVDSDPDVTIFQGQGRSGNGGVAISWLVESMNRIGEPNYNHCHYSLNSCFFDDDRNYRIPFWATQINWNKAKPLDLSRGPTYYIDPSELLTRSHKINFYKRNICSMASSKLGRRLDFYPKISKAIPTVHAGDFLRNTNEVPQRPGNSDYFEKINFISGFLAHLCFENDNRAGYVCEKILHSFYAGCIPIYWGPDASCDFNPEAYIHIDDFNCDYEAIEYIASILGDPEKITQYLTAPIFKNNKFPYHATPDSLAKFFEGIL